MIKKLLLSSLLFLLAQSLLLAQPVTVSGITTAGRFSTCSAALGQPNITCNFVSGPGSHVTGGVLICDNPCDSTVLDFSVTNIRWNQSPGINWLHGVFFPNANGITLTGNSLGAGWAPFSQCTGATCSAGISGGLGYYFDGTTSNSCCGAIPANDGIPANNWGVGTIDCNSPAAGFSITFRLRICNLAIIGNTYTFKLRGTADGGTGCWNMPDATTHTIVWNIATQPCSGGGSLYTPGPTATPVSKTCSPAVSYSTTFTGGCGNGNTISWWTASTGGTQIGTGSPFVFNSATCPAGITYYAACCPGPGTCVTRMPVLVPAGCPPAPAITAVNITQPTCSTPTGSINSVTTTGTSGTVTYTLTPGGSNTTGAFPGLTPGGYTLTITDATGCSASQAVVINTPVTGGPGPSVTSPVNYCQNATAVPLAATGTNVLYYTVATGGTGLASYTPSTTMVGTFTYYASQNPTGSCESSRTPITVIVSANSTITLTSTASTTNQTVCVNTAITNITYSTAFGVTGATVAGLPAGVTGVYGGGTNGTFTISGTPTATGTFNYTVTTSGGCGVVTATGTIVVSTAATMTLSSAAGSDVQTICINAAPTNITYAVGGGATSATAINLPAGVTGTYSAGIFTIGGTATTAGTFNYSVTTVGGCGAITLTGTITVTPAVTLTLTSAAATTSQTICVNAPLTPITYSTANGVTGATITGLPAGINGVYSGGTNGTIAISGRRQ